MMTHVRSISGGGCVLQGVCAHTERMVCGTLLGFQSASASWPYTALVTAGSSLDPRHSAQVSPITTHYVQICSLGKSCIGVNDIVISKLG